MAVQIAEFQSSTFLYSIKFLGNHFAGSIQDDIDFSPNSLDIFAFAGTYGSISELFESINSLPDNGSYYFVNFRACKPYSIPPNFASYGGTIYTCYRSCCEIDFNPILEKI
jgi:hypothetical protein